MSRGARAGSAATTDEACLLARRRREERAPRSQPPDRSPQPARSPGEPPRMPGLLARVYITPKRGILDPQGKAVQHSLHALGFAEVQDVKVGKYIEIRLRETAREAVTARVREMCERLLANGVIEDFRFEVGEETR